MCGCSGGACIIAPRGGAVHGCWGVSVCFFPGGVHGFFWGGCAWFLPGGMHGFCWGGMHGFCQGGMLVFSGGACVGYDEIRSMSGRYAPYWNAFLCYKIFCFLNRVKIIMKVIRSNALAQCSATYAERKRRSTTEVYFDKQVMETAILDNLQELATVKQIYYTIISDLQVYVAFNNQ